MKKVFVISDTNFGHNNMKDGYCETHDFYYPIPDDMKCPVCYGYSIGYEDGWSDGYDAAEGLK